MSEEQLTVLLFYGSRFFKQIIKALLVIETLNTVVYGRQPFYLDHSYILSQYCTEHG